jgi:hypothetical protein
MLLVLPCLLVVDVLYRRTYELPYLPPDNLLPSKEIADKYKLVKVGNSHSQEGINLDKFKTRTLNLSGVAQKFEFDLALLKQNTNLIEDGAVILIAVSPISFSHTQANSWKGFQSGYYRRVTPFYIPNLNWGDYIESQLLPFTRSGHFWRKKHAEAIRERISLEERSPLLELSPTPEPMPVKEVVKTETPTPEPVMVATSFPTPSPVVVVAPQAEAPKEAASLAAEAPPKSNELNIEAMESMLRTEPENKNLKESVDFTYQKWYHTDEFSPEFFPYNRQDLEKLIRYARQHNWRPVLVTVPISQDLQEGLLDDYMQTYVYDNLQQTDLQGVEYLDFTQEKRITTKRQWFDNADHLSKDGAKIFTYLLMKELVSKGYLSSEVNGFEE